MLFALILTWGVNFNNQAQGTKPKPKSSNSQKSKSSLSSSKIVQKKQYKGKSSQTYKKPQASLPQTDEANLAITKAKGFFNSGFILQTYRLLNPYKDRSEMDADAFRMLAECLKSVGSGIDTDYKLAERYFLQSIALKPSKEAFMSLGTIYELGGFNLKRDAKKALIYFQKAAEENVAYANFELGRLYFQGLEDSLRDEKKGINLLEIAGNQDVAEAQWMLGSIYAKGQNTIARDMLKAKTWFKKYKENKTIKQEMKL
jgi:TPR repeat protein